MLRAQSCEEQEKRLIILFISLFTHEILENKVD